MSGGAQPAYSVIVAAYNAEATIGETLASVLGQTLRDLEVVVVDDGSTDHTARIVEDLASGEPRIRLVQQANAGTAAARNAGWAHASGARRVFLDADDMLLPEYLAEQDAFIAAHPGHDIYSCNVSLLLRDGRLRPYWTDRRHASVMSLTAEDQITESGIFLMSVITPRVWEITGGFRDLHSEDYDFWLRALLGGATHIHNPKTLAVYRRGEGSKTTHLVDEAMSFLQIQRDAAERPDLTPSQRDALGRAIAVSEARVGRRRLEEALLAGEVPKDARAMYRRYRLAYPDRGKYLAGLVLMFVSPSWYGALKRRRFV